MSLCRPISLIGLRPQHRQGNALAVDATSVGTPVVDYLRHEDLSPIAITITAGDSVTSGGGTMHVPKRDLVGALVLERGRLRIAGALPLMPVLLQELAAFQVRITQAAHDTYGVGREGAHDDLVLAVALAVWYAPFCASAEFLRKAYGW